MGCDIHMTAEKKVDGKWQVIPDLVPFDRRSYGMFGFLAGVRNYSDVTPIAEPRGLPADSALQGDDAFGYGDHSFSWLSVSELADFDYDQMTEDRRYTGMHPLGFISGAMTANPGEGKAMTYREFLGESFFDDLDKLVAAGAERIVFGFDS